MTAHPYEPTPLKKLPSAPNTPEVLTIGLFNEMTTKLS